MPIDPYAPPTSTPNQNSNTTYLTEDGYAFQNELIANQHFKSPLICAKLGIPIPPESNPLPLEIVVKRVPKFPGFLNYVVFFLSIPLFIFAILTTNMPIFYSVIFAFILAKILNRLFFLKPYKIPFYFSELYTRRRANRKLIFITILLALAAILLLGILAENKLAFIFSTFAIIISSIIFSFKSTYFIVTETKGDYHYIRGVHKGLLKALPHLPLSS